MQQVVKISEAASLALHTMVLLAANTDKTMSTKEVAHILGVSEAHLAKVLQRLGRAGLVQSRRGPGGGFSLARDASTITLMQVYQGVEGPLQTRHCLLGKPVCHNGCILGHLLDEVGDRVEKYFSQTKLSDLANTFVSEESHG
jgi:Rrf2 family protein